MKKILLSFIAVLPVTVLADEPTYEVERDLEPAVVIRDCQRYEDQHEFISKIWRLPRGKQQVAAFNGALSRYGKAGFSLTEVLPHPSIKVEDSRGRLVQIPVRVFVFQRTVRICADSNAE